MENKQSKSQTNSGSQSGNKSGSNSSSKSGSQSGNKSGAQSGYQSGSLQASESANKQENLNILNQIYQNAQMGKQSISTLMTKVEDEELKKELASRYQIYDEASSKSSVEIIKLGDKPKDNSPLTKVMSWGTLNITTLVDNSTSNIADLMIKGSHYSINDLNRLLNQNKKVSKGVKDLAQTLLDNEQNGVDNLKKFL